MKRILSTFVFCLIATASALAQDLVATLLHEGNTTMYYGVDAFKAAVEASANGDIITLSPGSFNGWNIINKSIIVRGNGAEGPNATKITTGMRIDKPFISDDPGLYIEGINFEQELLLVQGDRDLNSSINYNITIKKCVINKFGGDIRDSSYTDYFGVAKNVTLMQCKVTGETVILRDSEYFFINCLLGKVVYSNYDYRGTGSHNVVFNHCTAVLPVNNMFDVPSPSYPFRFTANNSILLIGGVEGTFVMKNRPVATDCIFVGTGETMPNIFDDCGSNGSRYAQLQNVFKTLTTASQYQENNYELIDSPDLHTQSGEDSYGMYSGSTPYNLTTSYPTLGTITVNDRANGGMLNVNVSIDNE